MSIEIVRAGTEHASAVCGLVRELAHSIGERTPVTEADVHGFLDFPGSGMLVAVDNSVVVGVLSFSSRPSLFHAGTAGLIEDLVVTASRRGQGIGGRLVRALLSEAETRGWVEASVSTETGNAGAISFYRKYGFVDESVFLERHFDRAAPNNAAGTG
jgi:ribosomal protein S18 acetylase RimI-like enzyme